MTTLADKSLLSGGDNKPPMLEKHLSTCLATVTVDDVTRPKDYTELTPAETIQADCDIKAINIILQGLPTKIYALVSQHCVAKDLWEKIKMLMQGTSLTKQERECKLYDEFDKFTYKKGESLHEYYLRFTLLLNDMNIYNMPLEQFQVNTKFLNTLPAEWSKFITDVKLVKDLHTTNIDQIHAHLEQHERHANEVRLINERNSDPLALVASHQMTQSPYQSHQHSYQNSQHQQFASPYQHSQYASQQYSINQSPTSQTITYPPINHQTAVHHNVYSPPASIPQSEYSPTVNQQSNFSQLDSGLTIPVFKRGDDPIDAINHVMSLLSAVGRQTSYAAGTTRTFTSAASGSNSGKQRIVTCYNCKGEGHMAQQCTKPKRQRNAAWYKEKAMLAEVQDAGQILDEEQLAFLADLGVPASQAIQASTIIPYNAAFQTKDLDTYYSDCDDLATAQAVLMANISSYGSNVISEVLNPEQYHNDIKDQINHEHNWEKTNKEQCNESLTAKLERYKERVKSFEQRLNIDLSSHEKMIDSQMDDMIREKLALKEQVDSLEQNLSKQIKEKECLLETFNVFQNKSKEKENKYQEKEIDLEKKIKELDNIVYKVGQSAQTVHMLTKPQVFYDNIHKQALGYQNPYYLKKAQRMKPNLYDGVVISNTHDAMPVIDDEETLILEEESRSKILSKDFKTRFTPQQELSAEQAFWFHILNPTIKPSYSPPVIVDVPSELPKVSLVNVSLKKLKFHLAQFDSVVKKRTTPSISEEGEWGFEHTKAVFNKEIIPFLKSLKDIFNMFNKDLLNEIKEVQTVFEQMEVVVQQSSVDKQCVEIAKKELLLENDRLLHKIMSQDVIITVLNSMSVNNDYVNMELCESCDKCLLLDAELSKSKQAYNNLLKNNSQLEKHCISLEVSNQLKQELFQKDKPCINQNALEILEYFDMNDLKARLQDKDMTICKLKDIIKSMCETSKDENVNTDLCELATKNVELENNYLRTTQEHANILREIVEQAKEKQPLDSELDFACKHATRIQELLIYVHNTCPNVIKPSAKKVTVTPLNKVKKVRFAEPLTSSNDTKQVESSKTSDSNTLVLSSTGVKCSTSNCGSKPRGNKKNDRISQKPSRNMKNKVEAQPRKVNKKNHVVEPICDAAVKHSCNVNSAVLCVTCNKSMFDGVHDKCLLDFVKNRNNRAKSAKKHKTKNVWKPTGHVFTDVGYKWKPTGRTFTIVGNSCPLTRFTSTNVVPPKQTTTHSVEIPKPKLKVYSRKPKSLKILGSSKIGKIVESKNANYSEPNHTWGSNATNIPSCSSLVMTGTVRFGNDQIARIMGYGDYQLRNVVISRVYYVEGLGHNLFSVGQFCDADLEVAFQKNTCFVRNLDGVDLFSRSRDTNSYTISLDDMLKSTLICLLSKASKTKSWLWHRRLSHLNFGDLNKLAKDGLARGLPRLKFQKDHLCSACALGKSKKSSHKPKAEDTNHEKLYLLHMDLCGPMRVASINGKRYILVIVDDYSRFTWVRFLKTKDEAPAAIIKCIKNIQVRLKATVQNVRTDNGTEFVNQTLHEFYDNVGISHQTSVARTP
ncbi:integrase, catalytic region, zinc finger, CCHC-type containing protein [Tanacetum coccineum]